MKLTLTTNATPYVQINIQIKCSHTSGNTQLVYSTTKSFSTECILCKYSFGYTQALRPRKYGCTSRAEQGVLMLSKKTIVSNARIAAGFMTGLTLRKQSWHEDFKLRHSYKIKVPEFFFLRFTEHSPGPEQNKTRNHLPFFCVYNQTLKSY